MVLSQRVVQTVSSHPLPSNKIEERNGSGSTQANSCFAFMYIATVLGFTYFMHSCGFHAFLLHKGLNLYSLLIILRLL